MINKILFITLSNIGDVVLTLPALDFLKESFPAAEITVLVGPRPKSIFENSPQVSKVIIYDKHSPLKEKIKLFQELKKEKFELVVDLRNTFFGALLVARDKTSPFLYIPAHIRHMRDKHLYKIKNQKSKIKNKSNIQNPKIQEKSLYIKLQDEEYIKNILNENNIKDEDKIIVVAAGARSHIKRWPKEKFVELISALVKEFQVKVVLVGDAADAGINKYIAEKLPFPIVDLTAKTTIAQLACLLKRIKLLITNDSAVLHIGSYLNIPILGIFGPTDESKYGPWSENSVVVKKDIFCRPCAKAQCRFGTLECLQLIKVEDVIRGVSSVIASPALAGRSNPKTSLEQYKRILIVRTDRIGDVLLSTPVIKALREKYPCAYIAAMVSPYAQEIVEGNPYLDEVIIYDKEGKHKNGLGTLRFALSLKKKKFDLALILHPTNRAHLVIFLAGIPRRIGYNRKLGILLTDRLKHTKQLGQKHELEYNLDLLRYLGIESQDKELFMPIKPDSERWAEEILAQQGITKQDKLLAIHPGASCPSKIWLSERFAEVADRLIEENAFKVLVVAGPKDIKIAEDVCRKMRHPAINLAGKTSVSQLASILKRCQLFISNDSGPVHIASGVGTPVISIFGRNQKGLNPLRWGPTGKKDCFLHKEVGCITCLAHNCTKDFACLKAISVDDVLSAAETLSDAGPSSTTDAGSEINHLTN